MAFEIPINWRYFITEKSGDKTIVHRAADFILENKATHTKEIVNAYILEKLQFYKLTSKTDGRLWEYFREHFEGWTTTLFHAASTELRGELRDYLRSHGVFVNLKRMDYALHDTLVETEQHEWTSEELAKVMKDGEFNSAVYKTASGFPTIKDSPIVCKAETAQQYQEKLQNKAVVDVKNVVSPIIEYQGAVANQASHKEESGKNTDETYNEFINQVLKKKINSDSERDPDLNYLAQYGNPKDPTTARQLSELTKIYFDESKKFGGDL
ncbi:hypothetical protein K3495_g16490, partial [Podosphaera aphanis]